MIRSAGISVAGTGGVAAGALIGANIIANVVVSEIAGATVDSAATISLTAENNADILAVSTGVAGSGAASTVLALTANVINNTTRAAITDYEVIDTDGITVLTTYTSDVDSVGSVSITAADSSEINSFAIGLSGAGGGSLGSGIATNEIENTVEALIESADIDIVNGGLALLAESGGNRPCRLHWCLRGRGRLCTGHRGGQ